MPERRINGDDRSRIDRLAGDYAAGQRAVRALLGLNVLVLIAIAVMFGYFRGEDATNSRNGRLTALAIQKSRVEAATRACIDTNERNRHGRLVLAQLLKQRRSTAETPAERLRIEQSEQATDKLIDAMLPHQDCAKVVALQTHVPLIDAG